MEGQLAMVRQALHALYTADDGVTRKAAENWLQNVRNSSGAWQLCLALLSRPGLADYEYHFAAQSLRLACCKVPEVLDPNVLQGLAVQLAALLLASINGGAWPMAGQVSSALAALAVRATCWEEEALVPQLLSLLAPQVAAAILADLTLLGGAGLGVGMEVPGVGGAHVGGAAVVAAAVGAELSAVYALLQVVSSLPEACAARAICTHSQRKTQVASALAADATVVPLLRATVAGGRALAAVAAGGLGVGPLVLGPHAPSAAVVAASLGGGGLQDSSALRRAGLQLLHAWAEQLGTTPRGLEHETELISSLYEALVTADTATLAAECICGLLATCTPYSRDGADDAYHSDTSTTSSAGRGAVPPQSHMALHDMGFTVSAGHHPSLYGRGQRSETTPGTWAPGSASAGAFRRVRHGTGSGNSGGGGGGYHGQRASAASRMSAAARPGAGCGSSHERQLVGALLLQRLLDGLAGLLGGAAVVFREQQQQALAAGAAHGQVGGVGAGPTTAAGGASDFRFWALWPDSTVLQAVCNVLCGAAAVVLPGALRGDAMLQARFSELWPHLMALLGHSNPEVALSCVSFWQDTYLAQLLHHCAGAAGPPPPPPPPTGPQAGGHAGGHRVVVVLQSHLPLLAQLLAGLVSRAALGPEAAAAATADARDLPEEVRMVRRELGATMRDLVGLVGLGHVAAFLERMISEHAAELLGPAAADGSGVAVAGAGGPGVPAVATAGRAPSAVWTRLESSLYAANVALCSGGSAVGGGPGAHAGYRRTPSPGRSLHDIGLPSIAGPPLEDAHVASIISTAAAAVLHPASSLKLAGTALTLLGGMAPWFASHPDRLARPLDAIRAALASADEKLARNAATALNRLCAHGGCAGLLLGRYSGWVAGLGLLLPGPEVTLRHKPAPGVDLTSRELLVASLMRLACSTTLSRPTSPAGPAGQRAPNPLGPSQPPHAGPSSSGSAPRPDLEPSTAPSLTPQLLLQQLLAPRVLAAAAELERLAGCLVAACASGSLAAHIHIWRTAIRQRQLMQPPPPPQHPHPMYPYGTQQHPHRYPPHQHPHHSNPHQQMPYQHQHHSPQAAPMSSMGLGGEGLLQMQRVPLCRPGAVPEVQQLGATAMLAAQRLGALASMLLFVPATGQAQDMSAGGGGSASGGAAGPRQRGGGADGARSGEFDRGVTSLVIQAVRAVWPPLLACLQVGTGAPTMMTSPGQQQLGAETVGGNGGGSGVSGGSVLLTVTQEGAQLLPAACSLLQGALLVAASPQASSGGASAGAVTSPPGSPEAPPARAPGMPAGTADLLASAVCLLTAAQVTPGTMGVAAPGVFPGMAGAGIPYWPGGMEGAAVGGGVGSGGAVQGRGSPHAPPPGTHVLGPPVCVLQLVLVCLPVCGTLLVQQASQQPVQPGQEDAGAAAGVVEQAVRTTCGVVRQACCSVQVPVEGHSALVGSSGPTDPDHLLQVLPVFQALLLHAPQALAASRELLEGLVAATVVALHCRDPEACRAVLDWTQLLLCCGAFAPRSPRGLGSGAAGPSSSTDMGVSAACKPSPSGAPSGSAAVSSGGAGQGGGLACLLVRRRQAPFIERSYAEIGALLDAPCVCCIPNTLGQVHTVAAVRAGLVPGAFAARQRSPRPGGGAGMAGAAPVGSLAGVVVLALMLSAAGGMPPDLMLPISACLHGAWQAVGSLRFRSWLRAAAVELSAAAASVLGPGFGPGLGMMGPSFGAMAAAAATHAGAMGYGYAGPMPWARLKGEALTAALSELTGEECERDVMKFKRSLKSLCGGKKKGLGGG